MSAPNVTVSQDRNALVLSLPDSPTRRFVAEPSQGAAHCPRCPFDNLGLIEGPINCATLCESRFRPDRCHATWKEITQ